MDFRALENTAFAVLRLDDAALWAVLAAAWTAGALTGLAARRGAQFSLDRIPHYVALMVVLNLTAALMLTEPLAATAMRRGLLWASLGVLGLCLFALGAVVGALGHARSVSARGDGRLGWMALFPPLHLALAVMPPRVRRRNLWDLTVLKVAGVVCSAMLTASGCALTIFVARAPDHLGRSFETDPDLIEESVQNRIARHGLPAVLREISEETHPQSLTAGMRILRASADGTTLRVYYALTQRPDPFRTEASLRLVQRDCASPPLRALLEAGAEIKHVYENDAGYRFGVITVTRWRCPD